MAIRLVSRALSLCALLLSAAPPLKAQLVPPLEEHVVVTATLAAQEESEIGAATTVIDRERIEESGALTVADLLRLVPGVDVVRSGDFGAVTSLFLRGASSTSALVLVNGVRVNSPYFSGYDFSTLTTESVERIEIVRGPFSALYGSEAMGGVVQIFTRPVGAAAALDATLEGGGEGSRDGLLHVSSGPGAFSAVATYRHVETDGERTNADWTQDNGMLRLEAPLGKSVTAALEGSVLDGDGGNPGAVGAETPRARATFHEERVALPVTFRIASDHEATFLASYVQSTPSSENPDDPFFGLSDTDARTRGARATDDWKMGRHRLTAVASWESSTVTASGNSGTFLDDAETSIWGAGLQDSIDLGPSWFVTVGARYDEHSEFGGEVSPRVAVAWLAPGSKWKVRASAGRAYRAPSVGELFFPNFGNPELEPERARSYEVGVERYVKGGRAEASVFLNDFEDLIVFDFPTLRNQNIGRARTQGLELGWRQQLAAPLALDAGYTYLGAEDRATGDRLLRRPRNRAYAAFAYRPLPPLLASLRTTFVGSRNDVDAVTFLPVVSPSYTRLDLHLRYDFRQLSPYVRVDNLTDREYEEADGYPVPGRRVFAGVEFRIAPRAAPERS